MTMPQTAEMFRSKLQGEAVPPTPPPPEEKKEKRGRKSALAEKIESVKKALAVSDLPELAVAAMLGVDMPIPADSLLALGAIVRDGVVHLGNVPAKMNHAPVVSASPSAGPRAPGEVGASPGDGAPSAPLTVPATGAALVMPCFGAGAPILPKGVIAATVAKQPFIMFAHPRSTLLPLILSQLGTVPDDNPVLMTADGKAILLTGDWKFCVLSACPYWCEVNESGPIMGTETFTDPGRGQGMTQQVLSATLLVTEKLEFYATLTNWRHVKCGACIQAARAEEASLLPAWIEAGNAEDKKLKQLLVSKIPNIYYQLRVWSHLRLAPPKISKANGNMYRVASSVATLASPGLLDALARWLQEDGTARLDALKKDYDEAVASLAARVEEGTEE